METVVANLGSHVTRRTLNGRSYLVAPTSLIREGVLPGSQGPLFYPADEITKDVKRSWPDGLPLVVWHPIDADGNYVRARDNPEAVAKQGIGFTKGAHARNGQLKVESWFDEELTRNFDEKLPQEHKILPRLFRGTPIEVSSGLDTQNEDKPGQHNGRAYRAVARAYVGDHVAVLPDQKGACDIAAGCGVLVNAGEVWNALEEGNDQQRKAMFARMEEESGGNDVLEHLKSGPKNLDELNKKFGFEGLGGKLTELELDGKIVRLPGGRFALKKGTGGDSPIPGKKGRNEKDIEGPTGNLAWNAFCPTGEGGGQDNSCAPGKTVSEKGSTPTASLKAHEASERAESASSKAFKTGKVKDEDMASFLHASARHYHLEAADANRSLGDRIGAGVHRTKAAEHGQRSKQHDETVGG